MNKTTTPEPGIYYDIPAEDYFSWDCFHQSLIPAIMKSARHLKHAKENDQKTKPMILGSLVDGLLLDPKELDNYKQLSETYINKGEEKPWNANSKDCKAELKEIIDAGKTPIKKKEMDKAEQICDGVMREEEAAQFIKDSKKQVCIVWDDPETGVRCKARIDLQTPSVIGDLKTSRCAEKFTFARDIVNMGYHTQAALYSGGWAVLNSDKILPWKWVVVENEAPFCAAVYELGESSLEAGRARYRIALAKYKDYMENDPELRRGYSELTEPIEVPPWEINKAYDAAEEADIGI